MKIRVGAIGVTGYSGLELMKLVLRHPDMECCAATASGSSGTRPLAEIHPQLRNLTDLRCGATDVEALAQSGLDTVFLCTPNEASHDLVPSFLAKGMRVIDFSGSFRLKDSSSYPVWYGFEHRDPGLLAGAAYGLPEWNAREIAGSRLVANPGCYPTSVLLPLIPLIRNGLLEPRSEIISDSKSGVTGAGRNAKVEILFSEVSENFRAYNPTSHRHVPEICQELGWDIGHFTFVPHLLPVTRGILSTIYVRFGAPVSSEQLEEVYRRCYVSKPFIRILGSSQLPEIRAVNHTNFCDIGWQVVRGGRRAIVFSALDNLIKGAAGQALQNFNLMNQLDETRGLPEVRGIEIHG